MIRLASSSSHGAPEVPKFIAPRQALFAAAMTQVAIALASKRAARGAR